MSDNVVTFKGKTKEPQERLVYVCTCGCRTFNMFADGNIICSYCDRELGPEEGNQDGWRKCLPVPPDVVEQDDGGTVNEHMLPDETLARRSTIKRINDWSDSKGLVFVYAYHDNGAGTGWMEIETEYQKKWLLEKLQEVVKFVVDRKVPDGADKGAETSSMAEGLGQAEGVPGSDGPEVG